MKRRIVPVAVALLALSACADGGETVGPRGGTIVSDDGMLVLDLMEDALDHDMEIVIEAAEDGCKGAVGGCYEVTPAGTALGVPAVVSLDYETTDLGDVEPEDLALAVEKNGKWRLLTDRLVDEEDGTVSGTTVFLSTFAIVERD